jgi:hypothetical protein
VGEKVAGFEVGDAVSIVPPPLHDPVARACGSGECSSEACGQKSSHARL